MNMSKKLKSVIVSIVAVVTAVAIFFAGFFSRELFMDEDARAAMYLIEKYKKYYYFEEDDVIDVISSAILDKYSQYYTSEEYELIKRTAKGYTDGIGISLVSDTAVIYEVIGNSPAERVGIVAGGEIVGYNVGKGFVSVLDTSVLLSDIRSLNDGDEITLKIKYGETEKVYTVKKGEYLRTYVKYKTSKGTYSFQGDDDVELVKIPEESYTFSENTAYIKYSSFSGKKSGICGSVGQIEAMLTKFKNEGKTSLIFDLRGNGGGYLDIMNEVASLIVPCNEKGKKLLTLYCQDKNGNKTEYYSDASKFVNYGIQKLIVMVDENSASASEALVGAIYDYSKEIGFDLKILVSSSVYNEETVYKSYGKGIMQTTYKNVDGSAVKLTTAKLFWPKSGISIHGVGITCDNVDCVVNCDKQTAIYKAIELAK